MLCALHLTAQWDTCSGPGPPALSLTGALTFLHLFHDQERPPPGAVARRPERMRSEWTHSAVTSASCGDLDWGPRWGSIDATPRQVEAGSLPSQADGNVVPLTDGSSLTCRPPSLQGLTARGGRLQSLELTCPPWVGTAAPVHRGLGQQPLGKGANFLFLRWGSRPSCCTGPAHHLARTV